MEEKIRRKALLILSCVLMLEAVGIRHVPNFQRVGLILYAAGMLTMYAMTAPQNQGAGSERERLYAVPVRRGASGDRGSPL